MKLNEFAVVGKGFLTSLVGLQANTKYTYYEKYVDTNVCMTAIGCPVMKKFLKQKKTTLKPILVRSRGKVVRVCTNSAQLRPASISKATKIALNLALTKKALNAYSSEIIQNCNGSNTESNVQSSCALCHECPYGAIKEVKRVTYHNECHYYGLKPELRDARFSKTQIKLALYYHFLLEDETGFICRVDIRKIAETLNCDIKTVKAANEVLARYGYICYSKITSHEISVYIPARKYYAQKGGTGYLTMSKSLFNTLVTCTDVNALRGKIRMLLAEDKLNIGVTPDEERRSVRMPIKDTLYFYPKYARYKQAAIDISTKFEDIFNVTVDGAYILATIKDAFNGKLLRSNLIDIYAAKLNTLGDRFGFELKMDDIFSLANMTIQYGESLIYKAFSQMNDFFENQKMKFKNKEIEKPVTQKDIKCLGAYVRTTIKNIRRKAISC